MGNLVGTIKRFLSNKNTVTVLALLAGVIVLWYFYNYQVERAITTIQIPYAINAIDTGNKIEADNIEYKEITKTTTENSDIITDISAIIDKYICVGTSVPANGFFYASQVCEQEELPNSVLDNMPEGYSVYTLSVNNELTYANSILPKNYIDLYVLAEDDEGKIIYGALINSIEVLAVRDSGGRDVFWDSTAGDSAYLLFAVPEEYRKLLEIAEKQGVDIIPVPRSASYSQEPGATYLGSEELQYFIMKNASTLE